MIKDGKYSHSRSHFTLLSLTSGIFYYLSVLGGPAFFAISDININAPGSTFFDQSLRAFPFICAYHCNLSSYRLLIVDQPNLKVFFVMFVLALYLFVCD